MTTRRRSDSRLAKADQDEVELFDALIKLPRQRRLRLLKVVTAFALLESDYELKRLPTSRGVQLAARSKLRA